MEDPFIREHIEDLLRNIRTQVLVKLIRPYTRVRIAFIAQVGMPTSTLPTIIMIGENSLSVCMLVCKMPTNADIPTYHGGNVVVHRLIRPHCLEWLQ